MPALFQMQEVRVISKTDRVCALMEYAFKSKGEGGQKLNKKSSKMFFNPAKQDDGNKTRLYGRVTGGGSGKGRCL